MNTYIERDVSGKTFAAKRRQNGQRKYSLLTAGANRCRQLSDGKIGVPQTSPWGDTSYAGQATCVRCRSQMTQICDTERVSQIMIYSKLLDAF